MTDIDDDPLAAAASRVRKEIAPQRDLWPGIHTVIHEGRPSRGTPMLAQAAAVLLLVGASSALTYLAVKDEPQIVQVSAPTTLVFETTAFGSGGSFDAVYEQAEGEFAARLGEELARLSPEARNDVERNLAVIRQAIADINAALEKEPDNVLLQDLLVKAYREELSLKHRVGNLTQTVMARNDI